MEFDPNILLNPDDALHLFAFHNVYLPIINDHPDLRTEQNRTPDQLWIYGMLKNMGGTHPAINSPMETLALLANLWRKGLLHMALTYLLLGQKMYKGSKSSVYILQGQPMTYSLYGVIQRSDFEATNKHYVFYINAPNKSWHKMNGQ